VIVQLLCQHDYPLTFFELSVCLRSSNFSTFILDNIIPEIDHETLGEENDAKYFVETIFNSLQDNLYIQHLVYRLYQQGVRFQSSWFIPTHIDLANYIVTMNLQYQDEKEDYDSDYEPEESNDVEEERSVKRRC
jgi:hypothetical protein